jgi:GNAT superfamily N-acetyltransferase
VATVFATAIDDLNRKHGFFDEPTPTSPPNPLYAFWLSKDPAAFWVAVDGPRVVGYTYSFLRGSFWFLADLFIQPEYQGKGIGGALIGKTLGSWKNRKISNRALITPAFNRASVSLYMRYGMLPRQPVYFASVAREDLARSNGARGRDVLKVEEISDQKATAPVLDRIHRLAMGFPQGWHNEFFSEVLKARCLLFRRNGKPVGYSFLRPDGRIGPLVVMSESLFRPSLDAVIRAAAESSCKEVTMFFPGTNEDAVMASIKHGFRITYPLLFLSAKGMGDWRNYMPYSPGLM